MVLSEHKPTKNPVAKVGYFGDYLRCFCIHRHLCTGSGRPLRSWLLLHFVSHAQAKKCSIVVTSPIFGKALLHYYQSGKSLPLHSKILIIGILVLVSTLSIIGLTKAGDLVLDKQQLLSLHLLGFGSSQ